MFRVRSRRNCKLFDVAKAGFIAAIATIFLALPLAGMAAGSHGQSHFDSPEQAVKVLIDASRAGQSRELLKILGHDGRKLVFSGDPVADKLGREKFVAAYDKANQIEPQGPERSVLVIGEKQWPFPIPLVKLGAVWHFDTQAGVEEILNRRIGRNELGAIQVCRAYVDAQRDYAAQVPQSGGLLEYAQHFMSGPNKRDGLYWPAAAGEPESPMGALVASARAEGYSAGKDSQRHHEPYHGYFYRILKRQGKHAPDGARDYLVDGRMVAGFALIAFPARHGDSGIMSFMVNQDGVVYQKNLGRDTESVARKMTNFNPDPSWAKAPLPAEK